MVRIELDDRPYIVGLQTGLPSGTLTMRSSDAGVLPNDEDFRRVSLQSFRP